MNRRNRIFYRALGFRVEEETERKIVIRLPWWVRGRAALVVKAIENAQKDADAVGMPVAFKTGYSVIVIEKGEQ